MKTQNDFLIAATAVTEVYGSGQKVIAAVLEYQKEIYGDAVHPEDFLVSGRTITGVCVSTEIRGCIARKGCFVSLTLDPKEPAAATCLFAQQAGQKLKVEEIRLQISQLQPISAADGTEIPPFFGEETCRTDNGIAERFVAQSFQTDDGQHLLRYNLYTPERMIPRQKYPLVLFLHDKGACSETVQAPLVQGNGAVVWARDSESGRRPCLVLAPAYAKACIEDSGAVSWEVDATIQLVQELCRMYPIDNMRIYATGQSMGCMMLCEMLLRNPGFFAGTLLVAGQWDPVRMANAKDEHIWAVVSRGDNKAFPVMRACMASMERAGGNVSRGHVDACAGASILSNDIRRQNEEQCNLNFTWFEEECDAPGNSLQGSQKNHIATWAKAYDIEELRSWLFEQRLNTPPEKHGLHTLQASAR